MFIGDKYLQDLFQKLYHEGSISGIMYKLIIVEVGDS